MLVLPPRYFAGALRPYVNFVPLWHAARDDVLPAVRWLKVHDRRARRIGAAGRRLACSHLTQPARLCYWRRLLRAYATMTDDVATLAQRPRAFPLARLNIMCRERDAPNVCYYNVRPAGKNAPPLPTYPATSRCPAERLVRGAGTMNAR